jgi:PRTRC genetic system protein B
MSKSTNMGVNTGGTQFTLASAILLYKAQGTPVYASIHDVEIVKNRPTLGAGVPITTQALGSMMEELKPTARLKLSFLSENVLASSDDALVWWVPPSSRSLFFKCEELGGKVVAEVPLPGLVFAVTESEWYVYAVKGNGRPTPSTPLFQSPFFNVWEGGRICTGNVSVPDRVSPDSIAQWEASFFKSWFTHSNVHAPARLVNYKGGEYAFWRDLLAGKKKFPERVLVESCADRDGPSTVSELISLAGKGGL